MTSKIHKAAFIHFAKAAGRYVDHYLCSQVFNNQHADIAEKEFKVFNSWAAPYFLGRDWTENELLQLANNRFPDQHPTLAQAAAHRRHWAHDYAARQYVHNHHHSWSANSIREFRRNGWSTFMFIREPGELLCSLWTWARAAVSKGADPALIIEPIGLIDLSLDAFIREVIGNQGLNSLFALPDYIDDIVYVAEFSAQNFRHFLGEFFDHRYRPDLVETRHRHASGNPGYAACRVRGWISDETHRILDENLEVRRVRERLGSCG